MKAMLAVLVIMFALPNPAMAFGPEGHSVVAMLAESRLSEDARTKIRALLMGAPLVTGALSADEYRVTHPETTRWHFVDIPFDATSYDPARDCAALMAGDCIFKAIERAEVVIIDPKAKVFDRADAVKYLVHFVGDIHQPFHAIERDLNGAGDEGGNKITLFFFDKDTNLHSLWDSGLILKANRSAEDYVKHLQDDVLPTLPEAQWRETDMVKWAMESHDLGKLAYVAKGSHLGQPYQDQFIIEEDKRLALAGARLAIVLEDLALKIMEP